MADRQTNVAALRSMGRDLKSVDLDPTEQHDLHTALAECMSRYDGVSEVCIQRRLELGMIESAMDAYRTRLDAFLSWLDVTEHCAAMTDVISIDVSIVQQQATQQQVCFFHHYDYCCLCCCCCCCCYLCFANCLSHN